MRNINEAGQELGYNRKLISSLSELPEEASLLYGTKAAHLAKMIQSGFNVPNGVAVSAEAFLLEREGKVDSSFVGDLQTEIQKFSSRLFAVRSSSLAEDSRHHSMAGVFHTSLNVLPEDVYGELKKVWNSADNKNTIEYAKSLGIDEHDLMLGVIIQEMVEADCAGVAFSEHPVSHNVNEILIEASAGVGENVVSGSVIPETYVLKRDSNEIEDLNVNKDKQSERVLGVILTIEDVMNLKTQVLKLEQLFGEKVDVEWAYKDGKLYILQCRAVTTLDDFPEVKEHSLFDTEVEWEHYITRPFSLLQSSVAAFGNDSAAVKEYINKSISTVLFVEQSPGATRQYRDSSIQLNYENAILDLIVSKPERLKEILLQSDNFNKEAQTAIQTDPSSFESLPEALNFCSLLYLISSRIPYNAGDLIQRYKINSPDILNLTQQIRMTSIHPQFFEKIILPLAMRQMQEDGYNLTTEEIKLLSITEILNSKQFNIPHLLSRRRNKRFIYQYKNGIESIHLVNDSSYLIAQIEKKDLGSMLEQVDQLTGAIAYPGRVTGIARVILDYSKDVEFEDGDILVTLNGNPNQYDYMRRSSAIISDEGGISCHAGIIAREEHIPCVMGTVVGTIKIPDGALIEIVAEVDAGEGIIKIIG